VHTATLPMASIVKNIAAWHSREGSALPPGRYQINAIVEESPQICLITAGARGEKNPAFNSTLCSATPVDPEAALNIRAYTAGKHAGFLL